MKSLVQIREEIGDCRRCPLHTDRKKIVFGEGNPDAPVMFVGEGPGAQEDATGRPFVGPAGLLLDKMIVAMGYDRADVYISNIVMCRPPENRIPDLHEVEMCRIFLEQKIQIIDPKVIVSLGATARFALLGASGPLGAARGKFVTWKPRPPSPEALSAKPRFEEDPEPPAIDRAYLKKHAARKTFWSFHGIPVMPTWHPAYLLRNSAAKPEAAADLKKVVLELARLGEPTRYPGALVL